MINRCILSAILSSFLLFTSLANSKEFDVYFLAGQSNMDGRADATDLKGDLVSYSGVVPDAILWYSNSSLRHLQGHSDGWVDLQPGYSVPSSLRAAGRGATTQPTGTPGYDRLVLPFHLFGPEIGFAHSMRAANHDRSLALIKFAIGSSNLKKEWNPDRRKLLYDQFIASAKTGLDAIKSRGDTYHIRGMLWHQGESDSTMPTEDYEKLLSALITRVRTDLNEPSLPIVLGEPFDNGQRIAIRTAQRNLAGKLDHVYCVSSVGLKTGDRDTHFDAVSQIEIGKRFAEAILNRRNAGPVPSAAPSTRPTTGQSTKDGEE